MFYFKKSSLFTCAFLIFSAPVYGGSKADHMVALASAGKFRNVEHLVNEITALVKSDCPRIIVTDSQHEGGEQLFGPYREKPEVMLEKYNDKHVIKQRKTRLQAVKQTLSRLLYYSNLNKELSTWRNTTKGLAATLLFACTAASCVYWDLPPELLSVEVAAVTGYLSFKVARLFREHKLIESGYPDAAESSLSEIEARLSERLVLSSINLKTLLR